MKIIFKDIDPSEKVRQKKEKEITWSDAEDVSKENTSWLK